jgi:hypothetical protein
MSLITPSEVSAIAFVNTLDPAQILPVFISAAETKFIVPTVTQALIDKIVASPSSYTTLIDNYIKPYLAFAVKYMFYNQLLTETNTFPPDNQRSDALLEVLNIMEVNKEQLRLYLNANNIITNATSSNKLISGFRITAK